MQEIAIVLSSLAGVATAAAVRGRPRIPRMGASARVRGSIRALAAERELLTKTIARLYEPGPYTGVQRDRLLSRYQHRLGAVLARIEKLEQAGRHPDLGPVGDGLITLMDQKLSRLDERLRDISSRMAAPGIEARAEPERAKRRAPRKPAEVPPGPRPSVEITTLSITGAAPGRAYTPKPVPVMPEQRAAPKPVLVIPEQRAERVHAPKPVIVIPEQRAHAPEPRAAPKPRAEPVRAEPEQELSQEDHADAAAAARIDKIKSDMARILSKMDQAEVE